MINCEKCTEIEKFKEQVGTLLPAYAPKVCLDCLIKEINRLRPVDVSKLEKEINSLKAKVEALEKAKKSETPEKTGET